MPKLIIIELCHCFKVSDKGGLIPSKTAEQPVNISISDKGKEYYHNSIRQNRQESYDTVLQQREQLKNEKISLIDYGYEISKKAAQLLNEKIAKQEQERSRLLQSWNNERKLSKASNAYEANVMTETVTDSASLLG